MVESQNVDLVSSLLDQASADGLTINEILSKCDPPKPPTQANKVWARNRMRVLIDAGQAELAGTRWTVGIHGRRTTVPVYRTKK